MGGSAALTSIWWLLVLPVRCPEPLLQPGDLTDFGRVQEQVQHHGEVARTMGQRVQVVEEAVQKLRGARASPLNQSIGAGTSLVPVRGESARREDAVFHTGEVGEMKTWDAKMRRQLELIGYNEQNQTYNRWRSDFRCGRALPFLPDGEAVECEPDSEAPCCSNGGWCGKSKKHCTCDECFDYQVPFTITVKDVKLAAIQQECSRQAHNFGEQPSPGECARLVVVEANCGRMFMFSQTFPGWGCRCCMPMTATGEAEHDSWSVYNVEVNMTVKPGFDR